MDEKCLPSVLFCRKSKTKCGKKEKYLNAKISKREEACLYPPLYTSVKNGR